MLLTLAPLALAADIAVVGPPARLVVTPPPAPVHLVVEGRDPALVATEEGEPGVPGTPGRFEPLSRSQYRWLKPKRGRLDPNPYGNTDFTAYSLEFGEVRLGLGTVTVGAFPRTQIGTAPLLNAVGIYNGHAKANLFRLKGFDLAARASGYWLPLGDFDGFYLDVGGYASQVVHPRMSIHAGASYTRMSMRGVPDFSKASPVVTAMTGDLSAYSPPPEWFGDDPPAITAEALTARLAVDYRFNRRDSLIVQAWTLARAAVVSDLGEVNLSEALPPIGGLDEALSYQGNFKVTEAYIASLSYQASWKQVDLRVGAGISSVPGAWAMQSTELAYRFGGKTRREETRQLRTWRRNARDVGPPVAVQLPGGAAAPPASPP
jgi:hypothetical protein